MNTLQQHHRIGGRERERERESWRVFWDGCFCWDFLSTDHKLLIACVWKNGPTLCLVPTYQVGWMFIVPSPIKLDECSLFLPLSSWMNVHCSFLPTYPPLNFLHSPGCEKKFADMAFIYWLKAWPFCCPIKLKGHYLKKLDGL